MSAYLVWFLLFILYLIVIPIGISPFEAPKVIIAEAVIDLLIIIRLIHFKKIPFKHLFTSQTLLLSIILLLSLDQVLLFHPHDSFFGNPFRLQGLFLFLHLAVFSFISKDILLSHIPKALYYLSFIFLFLATVILGVNPNYRAFGTLGEPNALAATTLFLLPFVFFRGNNITKIASFASALLIIILSGSRAGLVGLSIESLFLALIYFKITCFKSVSISSVFILLSLILPLIEGGGWFENRSQIWQTALQAGLQSPILGNGFGNIQNPIHQNSLKLDNQIQYQVVDSSHNFVLDLWIQSGIVGIISIITLICLSFHGLIKQRRKLELTAFLGIITAMLFNPVSVVNLVAFWWLIGQGFTD